MADAPLGINFSICTSRARLKKIEIMPLIIFVTSFVVCIQDFTCILHLVSSCGPFEFYISFIILYFFRFEDSSRPRALWFFFFFSSLSFPLSYAIREEESSEFIFFLGHEKLGCAWLILCFHWTWLASCYHGL